MEKHTIHTKSLNRFLQILDSSFPSGSFVHSFGLEPYIVLGKVKNCTDLKKYFENLIIDQYQKLEFPFVKKIFILLKENNLNLLIKEDIKFSAILNYEFSKASLDIGQNYLKQINFEINKTVVKKYFEKAMAKHFLGNELVVLSAYAYELDINCDTFLLLWSKKNIINTAYASLKISRISPSDLQKLLFEFDDKLGNCIKNSSSAIQNFNIGFEEVIYQHARLEPKMFAT